MRNIGGLIWLFAFCYLRNRPKCLKVYQICYLALICSEDFGILCQMLPIYQEIQAIIKWFVYFMKDENNIFDTWVTCIKTRPIKCDQVILYEKIKLSYRVTFPELYRSLATEKLVDSFLVSVCQFLWTGITFAFLHSLGKHPFSRHFL